MIGYAKDKRKLRSMSGKNAGAGKKGKTVDRKHARG